MITDSYSKMTSDVGTLSALGFNGGDRDIEELRLQEASSDCERELRILRSGSAPLTVEEQIGSVGGGDGGSVSKPNSNLEEDIRYDSSCISSCYSNGNKTTRFAPPLLSKEDRPLVQRMQGGGDSEGSLAVGRIGDWREVARGNGVCGGENGSCDTSLFSMQPAFGPPEAQKENVTAALKEWEGDRLIGLPVLEAGSAMKSFAEIIQDDTSYSSVSTHPSRLSSCVFDTVVAASKSQFAQIHELSSGEELRAGKSCQGMSTLHNTGTSANNTYDAVLGDSLPRSTMPDPRLGEKGPIPNTRPVGMRVNSLGRRNANIPNSFHKFHPDMGQRADLVSALSGMSLSGVNSMMDEIKHPTSQAYEMDEGLHFQGVQDANNRYSCLTKPVYSYHKGPSRTNLGSTSSPSCYSNIGSLNSSFSSYMLGGCAVNPSSSSTLKNELGSGSFSPLFENISSRMVMGPSRFDSRAFGGRLMLGPNSFAAAAKMRSLGRMENPNSQGFLQMPMVDPVYLDYTRSIEFAAAHHAVQNDQIRNREALACSHGELLRVHKNYPGMFSSQKSQYGLRSVDKTCGVNQGYFVSPSLGPSVSYPGGRLRGPLLPNSPIGAGSYVWRGERSMHFPSEMRNSSYGVMGSWYSESGSNLDESFVPSFPDDIRNERIKGMELGEIAGIVVDFSVDQFGSRFIQQKLETATIEEKDMVFREIMPKALSLMTDVFGNYVIQKFLEHGSAAQIRDLGNQLIGHVLELSLQMYGCRVIQKAIQVVELDQKTKMVEELDGHVMRCVRDQNGNHVIQKCIECIPENAIEFIMATFYDQVVALSTHPYGCRVIQRVLENCRSPKTQSILMTEILSSVCMLAQDQYGNYVVQHLLQHGKPHERATIINELGVQIVQMSQQKYASNVVEKCLTYGTPEQRKLLVNQMLGSSDENEPLQAMMKDQFGNYVVQKVLEICDDQQLELILNRIKVHLDTLKKYTYGKHIVARVEKLVAAGEKRIGIQSYA